MKRIFDFISMVISWICFCLMVLFSILVVVQVVSRYFFNSPTTWTELVARYLFVWSVMLYMPVLYRDNANPAFDLIHARLHGVSRFVVDIVIDVATLFSALFLFYWGMMFCIGMKAKVISGLGVSVRIPMNIVYSAIPAGGLLLALMCVERLFVVLMNKKKEK